MATDDRWDDEGDRDRRGGRRGLTAEQARSKVTPPAIGLILMGVLTVAMIGLGVLQYNSLPAQFDEQIKQFDTDPNLKPEQRDQAKEMMKSYQKLVMSALPVTWGLAGISSLVMIAAGVKMMSLSGRGLGIFASILAMIPCVSGCCLIGLPIGIWALVVLNGAGVKAAFAAKARSGGPDDFDDRRGDGEPL